MSFKINKVNPDKAVGDALLKYEQSSSRNIMDKKFICKVIS